MLRFGLAAILRPTTAAPAEFEPTVLPVNGRHGRIERIGRPHGT